jgi:hypothetical protein
MRIKSYLFRQKQIRPDYDCDVRTNSQLKIISSNEVNKTKLLSRNNIYKSYILEKLILYEFLFFYKLVILGQVLIRIFFEPHEGVFFSPFCWYFITLMSHNIRNSHVVFLSLYCIIILLMYAMTIKHVIVKFTLM